MTGLSPALGLHQWTEQASTVAALLPFLRCEDLSLCGFSTAVHLQLHCQSFLPAPVCENNRVVGDFSWSPACALIMQEKPDVVPPAPPVPPGVCLLQYIDMVKYSTVQYSMAHYTLLHCTLQQGAAKQSDYWTMLGHICRLPLQPQPELLYCYLLLRQGHLPTCRYRLTSNSMLEA
jgi:hypothetical protein